MDYTDSSARMCVSLAGYVRMLLRNGLAALSKLHYLTGGLSLGRYSH